MSEKVFCNKCAFYAKVYMIGNKCYAEEGRGDWLDSNVYRIKPEEHNKNNDCLWYKEHIHNV